MFGRKKSPKYVDHDDFDFKKTYAVDKRHEQSAKIRIQYPNYVPLIVEPANKTTVRQISKTKFLVPADYQVVQFMQLLRKHVELLKDQSIFIFTEDGSIPAMSGAISKLYENKKNQDGFLYIHYATENTFGK